MRLPLFQGGAVRNSIRAARSRVDAGRESLERRVPYTAADLVDYSPVTKARVGEGGMALGALCEAALTLSDNTAGNLMLKSLGGPQGITEFARSLGDTMTRLDRFETELNEALPGDPRDTTTPRSMMSNLQKLVFGDVLSAASKDQLTKWLLANKTGDTRLRAGLPAGWRVGDKTGSGERGTTNDIGVVWAPNRTPVVIAVYLTGTSASAEKRNATLAAVGRALTSGG